jgi:uncharacterized repeat protein (TIGR02543 family)
MSPLTISADDASLSGSSFDVVFVMDNSGSMSDSDPNELSFMAAQLFVDLCSNSNSRMGYVGFSDKVKDKRPIQEINGNTSFRDAFNDVEFLGGTNISAGLSEAYGLFQSAKKSEYGNKQVIILLGDGNNWPTQSKSIAELDTETETIANTIKSAGIEIYTIGFNYDGTLNTEFMEGLSSDINQFYEARYAYEIPDIMSRIYMNLFNGSSKHIGDFSANGSNQYVTVSIPEGVYESDITFVSNNSPINDIVIFSPDGEKFDNTHIIIGSKYSFARIIFPQTGDWKVQFRGTADDTVAVDLISIYDIPDYATVNVVFESNSETIVYPQNVKYGEAANPPQNPVKPDYIFGGWFTDATFTTPFDFSSTITKDITLYAKWTMEVAGVYTVNFDMNGGSFVNPLSVAAESSVELPDVASFERTGYIFSGFYLDKNTTIAFKSDEPITQDITLYAKWTEATANIIPVIISFAVLTAVAIFAFLFFPNIVNDKLPKSSSPFLKSLFGEIINIIMCLTVYTLFTTYLIPKVFNYTNASSGIGDLSFDGFYVDFVTITACLVPFLLISAISYVIPCATNLMRNYKKKQYKTFLLMPFLGLLFPLFLTSGFGLNAGSGVALFILYILSYNVNFILSSLAFSTTTSKSFSLWG